MELSVFAKITKAPLQYIENKVKIETSGYKPCPDEEGIKTDFFLSTFIKILL